MSFYNTTTSKNEVAKKKEEMLKKKWLYPFVREQEKQNRKERRGKEKQNFVLLSGARVWEIFNIVMHDH